MEKGYNGWTNYETWNLKLWIDNDQGESEYWQEQAQEAYDRAEAEENFTKEENAALTLKDQLKDHYEEIVQDKLEAGDMQSSFMADMLNSAMSEVNWYEIAENMLTDVNKETA